MQINKDWEIELIKQAREIVAHGYGRLYLKAEEIKQLKTKIKIEAGRSFVYFEKREVKFDFENVL